MPTLLKPSPLPKKATIGIISPASPQRDPDRLMRGVKYLESLGHTIVLGNHALRQHQGYLAGTDADRLADIHAMFADKRIDAVFCARGGYGTPRLLASIDYRLIRKNPKIFVGFSDTTALQFAMLKHSGLVTFSGAMPSVDMADGFDAFSEESFWRAITSRKALGIIKQPAPITQVKPGTHEGMFVAGNLSLIVGLLGTPYMPVLKKSILAIEDIGEESYRIDRMLRHLINAEVLQSVSALITGYWTQKHWKKGMTPHRDVHDVIQEAAEFVRGPVLSDLMYGHEASKLTLPIGVRASITARGALKFVEAATS